MIRRWIFVVILSDGEYMLAFAGGRSLNYVLRDSSQDSGRLKLRGNAARYFEDIRISKNPGARAAIVATERLTFGERWHSIEDGETLVFKNGELAFRNGEPVSRSVSVIEDVEVYDSSRWLDGQRADKRVIGLPQALRERLGIAEGDLVRVANPFNDNSVELMVFRTDHRLLAGGTCTADESDCHACIPRKVRKELELAAVESPHRSGLDGFRNKYGNVLLSRGR